MKKIISLLVAVLLVSLLIPAVFAAEATTFTLSVQNPEKKETWQKGDIITVDVYQTGAKISGFGFEGFTYSTDGLKLLGEDTDDDGWIEPCIAGKGVVAIMYGPGGISGGGTGSLTDRVVFSLQFEVIAESGEFSVGFASVTADGVAADVYGCTIQVGEKHVCAVAEWKVTKAATCTEKGVETGYCSCGEALETRDIPALGHAEEIIPAVPATCTATGLTEGKKCSRCGEILVAQEVVDMLPHTWGKDVAVGDYNCEDGSETTHTCSVCGAVEAGEPIAPHKHDTYALPQGDTYTVDGKIYQDYIDFCHHGNKDYKGFHGCDYQSDKYAKEIGEEPPMGDITPYITMSVLTVVALVSAAAYLFLKRKAI